MSLSPMLHPRAAELRCFVNGCAALLDPEDPYFDGMCASCADERNEDRDDCPCGDCEDCARHGRSIPAHQWGKRR